ncbi:glycosyltransferase family 2 protein [Vibrio rumoiensis]|uniref:glycosyltransferase family 2 protein n=1 Tax=Vibrio rumoiensis TaxID=76258 RepID=UPI003AA915CC
MKLTIISIYYNRQNYVEESVNSLVSQISNEYEVILVDDGSTDNTLDELNKFKSENVKVITQNNFGFTPTIKKVIQNIDTDFVAIHGSGDVSLAGRFDKQLAFLESNPSYGVVGCYCLFTDILTKENVSTFGHNIDGDAQFELLNYNLFTHGEVMFKKSFYDQVGGYREQFKFSQDYDLWLRMSAVCKFHTLKEPLYKRMINVDGSVNSNAQKLYHQLLFSEFAKYCHRNRLANGIDPLDKFGMGSLLAFNLDRSALIKLWKKSVLEGQDFLIYCPKTFLSCLFRFSIPLLSPFSKVISKLFGKNRV